MSMIPFLCFGQFFPLFSYGEGHVLYLSLFNFVSSFSCFYLFGWKGEQENVILWTEAVIFYCTVRRLKTVYHASNLSNASVVLYTPFFLLFSIFLISGLFTFHLICS